MFGFFKKMKRAKQLQDELNALFPQIGMNFMHLHPQIHNIVLRHALQDGAPHAFQTFVELGQAISEQHPQLSEPEKAALFHETYVAVAPSLLGEAR